MINVEIYSKKDCPWCEKAKNIFNGLNIKYKDYILDEHYTKQELLEKVPDAKSVPQIFINNKHIGGYNELAEYMESVISDYAHDI